MSQIVSRAFVRLPALTAGWICSAILAVRLGASAITLHGQLARRFADHQIFMDVQGGVRAGALFADEICQKVARCDVLIALIGRYWHRAADRQGRRRIDNPDDLVRIEMPRLLRRINELFQFW